MASTTVDSTSDRPLQLDSIPTVDLRLLSQSELYSLSLCSDSAFDLRRCDDVVIPKIDRSVFNESAGSRKQTYSRLRLAPAASSTTIHRRTPHLRSHIPPSNSIPSKNDPEQAENSQIINLLKELFKSDSNCNDFVPIEVEYINPAPDVTNPVTIVGKRKRGRPRKDEKVVPKETKAKGTINNVVKKIVVFDNVEDRDKEIVNNNGVVIDMATLAELEDPYGPEIRRRTVGMATEDQLLGFLKGLNGQWGSRRKKKRVVDASDFGDALPKGWRLSLSIKKKVGRVWLFCRRYISPSGRQFASCREISAYLLSIHGPQNSDKPNCAHNNDEHASKVTSGNDLQVNSNGNIVAEESSDNLIRSSSNDKVCGMDEVPDVVAAKSDSGVVYEAALSNNENNSNHEPSGETHVIDSVDKKTKQCFLEQETSGSCVLSPFPNEQTSGGVVNNVVAGPADVELLNEVSVSEMGFLPSNTSGAMATDVTGSPNYRDNTRTAVEHTLDTYKVANGESLTGFCNTPAGLDEDGVTEMKQRSCSEVHSLVPQGSEEFIKKADGLKPSMRVESELKRGLVSSILVPSGDEDTCNVDRNSNRVCSSLLSPNLDGKHEIHSNECRSSAGLVADVTSLEQEKNFENCSAISSWREKVCASENNGNVISTCMVEKPRQQISCESSLLQPGCEPSCCIENNEDKVSSKESEEVKVNEFQTFGNNEAIVHGDGSQSGLNPSVMTIAKERNLEFCSLIPSANEQTFDLQDDVSGLYDSAMEECKEETSERGLLNQFCIAETSDDVFVNKLYNSPLDELKFDEDRDIGNHELSLAFGNPHAGLYTDTTSMEQKRDLADRSFVPSEIEQTFGVQTNLSMVNSSMVQDLKEGRGPMSDLFSLSCNSGTNAFGNNFNTVYTGREWEERKVEDVGNSVNKTYMMGFGSSPYQPGEDGMPSAMWKTGGGNALQSGLASNPLVQSPSCFPFDIISDKAEDGLFRLGENYNNGPGVNGFRSGRSEPVEFSFLTAHNSNSLQGNSKDFSYGTEMGQEFNPSFWLGKGALMPNIAANQVTAVCVWCRNEFQHEPGHSGIQAGIGSMCPTCSARIS